MTVKLAYADDRGARIVFTSSKDGNLEIYTADASSKSRMSRTENWVRLTNNPMRDTQPVWSPDGKKIAFTRYDENNILIKDIYVMDADGGNQINLTNFPAMDQRPDWSPDGKRIVFHSLRGNRPGIWLMDADGKNLKRIVENTRCVGQPVWSPNGDEIACTWIHPLGPNSICVMDTNGKNQRIITDEKANEMSPAWSPDGAKISFTSDRDGRYELYIMDSDGRNQERVVEDKTAPPPPVSPLHTWTSDGRIVFRLSMDISTYIVDADGNNQNILLEDAISSFDWFGPSPHLAVETAGKLGTRWGALRRYPRINQPYTHSDKLW